MIEVMRDAMASARDDLARNGFFVWRGGLELARLGKLREEIDRYAVRVAAEALPTTHDTPGQSATLKSMNAINQHDAWFADVLDQLALREMAENLLAQPVVVRNVQWFDKPPAASDAPGTPPHQDAVFSGLQPAEGLTFWLPLDSVDRQNGCLWFVPGSHLAALEHAGSDTAGFSRRLAAWTDELAGRELATEVEPGDVVVFHILTVHRTDPNRSTRHRRALGIQVKTTRARETNPKAFRPNVV